MPLDTAGNWYPKLFDRQLEVFNATGRALLVCGPRKSGKTIACLHKIVRHLWEVPDARVAMFSKTIKNAKEGGTWMDLHRMIIPEWVKAKIGLRYTTETSKGVPGPKQSGDSRTPYFRIRNAHGGESELMLFSLDYDDNIETQMKETRFSMIYFSELSKFLSRKVLSAALPQLRMPNIPYELHQWISDTNPAEEGDQSWIYKVWYVEKNQSYEQYCDSCKREQVPAQSQELFEKFKRSLELIEIRPEENPFLDPRELDELKVNSSYDIGIYSRDVEGKWVYGEGDSSRHFRSKFKDHLHIIGDCDDPDESKWKMLNPFEQTFELITGWDLGETNHAAVIFEQRMIGNVSHFFILDEQLTLSEEISNEEFTLDFMQLIEGLEHNAGRQFDLRRSWSDNSSTGRYSATGDTFPYLQVYAASKQRIYLQGVPKPHHSIKVRVRLVKFLLHQNRIHVSAHCRHTIHMFKNLKKGKTEDSYVVRDSEGDIHIFSALSYALLMECSEELESMPIAGIRESYKLPLVGVR